MNIKTAVVGTAMDRVDGVAKVTGQARYAGEYPQAGLLHGSVVSSTIARGRVLDAQVKVKPEESVQAALAVLADE